MPVTETPRLILRHVVPDDAPHVLALLTDADFVANIGDRGVHSLADARAAIAGVYQASYDAHGFGMFAVIDRTSGAWLGMAGLVRRDGLDHVDIGYAFLPPARGRGYALEAVRAVLDWAAVRGIAPVVAIVNADNVRSIALLERVGLRPDGPIRPAGIEREVILYIPMDMKPR